MWEAVDGDALRAVELSRPGARGSRQATAGGIAFLQFFCGGAFVDPPAEGEEKSAVFVEDLDPVAFGVDHVGVAVGGVDGDALWFFVLTGFRAPRADDEVGGGAGRHDEKGEQDQRQYERRSEYAVSHASVPFASWRQDGAVVSWFRCRYSTHPGAGGGWVEYLYDL